MNIKCVTPDCVGELTYRNFNYDSKKLFYSCGVCTQRFVADVEYKNTRASFKEWSEEHDRGCELAAGATTSL